MLCLLLRGRPAYIYAARRYVGGLLRCKRLSVMANQQLMIDCNAIRAILHELVGTLTAGSRACMPCSANAALDSDRHTQVR